MHWIGAHGLNRCVQFDQMAALQLEHALVRLDRRSLWTEFAESRLHLDVGAEHPGDGFVGHELDQTLDAGLGLGELALGDGSEDEQQPSVGRESGLPQDSYHPLVWALIGVASRFLPLGLN